MLPLVTASRSRVSSELAKDLTKQREMNTHNAKIGVRSGLRLHGSGKQLMHHLSRFHARQTTIQPLIGVSESLVIDTQTMKDGGVEIAYVNRILDDIV